MKKVAIIGTAGIPASYGGFESLVENLTNFSSKNIKYTVYCSSKHYQKKLVQHNNADLKYLPLRANGIQSIIYDVVSMLSCVFNKQDVVLVLGVSGCAFLPIFRFLKPSSKIVTNIDGLEWRREKWGRFAKYFLKKSESMAIKYSHVLIADNQAIGDYVNESYNKRCVIIAYGGDHVICKPVENIVPKDYFLSICRIEPENNISMILKSFAENGKNLKFIGNWDASEYGKGLKDKYKLFANIEIIDPIYDVDELYTYRSQCRGYIHGHSAGGTNPSLVEIMHFAVPIYAYDCNFNKYTTEGHAIYFADSNDLTNKINDYTFEAASRTGNIMKEIALRRYKWDAIVSQYESTY